MDSKVIERPELHRFELTVEDSVAHADYRIEDDRIILIHVEVPQELSGRGIGSQLARGVLDIIRATHRKAVLKCPFMAGWYSRHLEYSDVVDG